MNYFLLLLAVIVVALQVKAAESPKPPVEKGSGVFSNTLLNPGPEMTRSSASDLVQLKDGTLLLVYTHFYGGKKDHHSAYIASRRSTDGGKTWTDKSEKVIENDAGLNVMSVSLLRLQDGRLALAYLRKESMSDCRPVIRFSENEAKTWSEPIPVITDEVGYYVLNNDRLIQLESGRLIAPVALQKKKGSGRKFKGKEVTYSPDGRAMVYYSDDIGKTWKRSNVLELQEPNGLTEPGVVALKDGRLMLFARTSMGSQYISFSEDNGTTWSEAKPSNIISPLSSASIKRIPSTGDLLLIWNDNDQSTPETKDVRAPFNAAISRDDGKTWINKRTIDGDPNGWFCYTSVEFVQDSVVLSHTAGNRFEKPAIAITRITGFDVDWLYK